MVEPGWYDDPGGSGSLRLWDGTAWTEQVRPHGEPVSESAIPAFRPMESPVGMAPSASVLSPPPNVQPPQQSPTPPPPNHGPISIEAAPPPPPPQRPREFRAWPGAVRFVVAVLALAGIAASGWFSASLVTEYRDRSRVVRGAGTVDGAPPGPGIEFRDPDDGFALRVANEWPTVDGAKDGSAGWEVAPVEGAIRQLLVAGTSRVGVGKRITDFVGMSQEEFAQIVGDPAATMYSSELIEGPDGAKLVRIRFDQTQAIDGTTVTLGQMMWIHLGDGGTAFAILIADPARLDQILPFVEPFGSSIRSLR